MVGSERGPLAPDSGARCSETALGLPGAFPPAEGPQVCRHMFLAANHGWGCLQPPPSTLQPPWHRRCVAPGRR